MSTMVAHSENEPCPSNVDCTACTVEVSPRHQAGEKQLQMVMSSLRRSDPKPSGKLLRLHLMRVPLA